jgi:hypothetical protein
VDSANLYQTLTEQVVPMFYNRDVQGIPRQWLQRIRHDDDARAAIHHRPHGQGIHAELLFDFLMILRISARSCGGPPPLSHGPFDSRTKNHLPSLNFGR